MHPTEEESEQAGSRIINSKMTDKMAAMDFCEKLLRVEEKEVRSIFWLLEDANGHHHFTCCWTVKSSN